MADKKYTPPRNEKGHFLPGYSGNPKGKPAKSKTIVQQFRENPKCKEVIEKVLNVALTLDLPGMHPSVIIDLLNAYEKKLSTMELSPREIEERLIRYHDSLLKDRRHPEAMACAKTVIDRTLPTLKQVEMELGGDSGYEIIVRTIDNNNKQPDKNSVDPGKNNI